MPAASWTTDEQYKWLQDRLATYTMHAKEKDYTHFWPSCRAAWFQKFPERAAVFPDIPMDVDLTPEQETILQEAREARESVRHFVSCCLCGASLSVPYPTATANLVSLACKQFQKKPKPKEEVNGL